MNNEIPDNLKFKGMAPKVVIHEHLLKMPMRFVILVEDGVITLEAAQKEWAKQQAQGAKFYD